MEPDDFDLNLLRVLDAVLSERSVTRAAERLHLSQPAVSHALARLRRALGDRLLERRGRTMELTPEGRRLARHVQEIMRQVRSEVIRGDVDRRQTGRRFVLALPDVLVSRFGPPLLQRLSLEAPKAGLELRPLAGQTDAALVEGQVDAAVGVAGSWLPPLRSGSLLTLAWRPVVAAANARFGQRASLADLAAAPHADVVEGVVPGLVDAALGAHGLRRRIVVLVGSHAVLPDLLDGTDLVAFLPSGHRLDRRLRWVELDAEVAVMTYQLWWGHASDDDPLAAWFRSVMRDIARELDPAAT